jgi:hypothetical protein
MSKHVSISPRRSSGSPRDPGARGGLTIKDGNRRLMIAALRYTDTFVKTDGAWLFAERQLYVDWIEERKLS